MDKESIDYLQGLEKAVELIESTPIEKAVKKLKEEAKKIRFEKTRGDSNKAESGHWRVNQVLDHVEYAWDASFSRYETWTDEEYDKASKEMIDEVDLESKIYKKIFTMLSKALKKHGMLPQEYRETPEQGRHGWI